MNMPRIIFGAATILLLWGCWAVAMAQAPLVLTLNQGEYPLGLFWELLAYCAGTGGSMLIIGSAAGVAAMGLERIDFIWYMKKISLLALSGYLAGAAVYWAQAQLLH